MMIFDRHFCLSVINKSSCLWWYLIGTRAEMALVSPLHGCILCAQNVMLFLPFALIKLASHFCQFVYLLSASTLIFYILLACDIQNLSCYFSFAWFHVKFRNVFCGRRLVCLKWSTPRLQKVTTLWHHCGATLLRYWVLGAWIWMHYILIAAWLLAKRHSLILS